MPENPSPYDNLWLSMGDETLEEKLISLQLCNNAITDDILFTYIKNVGESEILYRFNDRMALYLERA